MYKYTEGGKIEMSPAEFAQLIFISTCFSQMHDFTDDPGISRKRYCNQAAFNIAWAVANKASKICSYKHELQEAGSISVLPNQLSDITENFVFEPTLVVLWCKPFKTAHTYGHFTEGGKIDLGVRSSRLTHIKTNVWKITMFKGIGIEGSFGELLTLSSIWCQYLAPAVDQHKIITFLLEIHRRHLDILPTCLRRFLY